MKELIDPQDNGWRYLRRRELIEAIQTPALFFGMEKLAHRLGYAESSMYAQLNPTGNQRHAKLSFDDAVEAMMIIKNYDALSKVADELGFSLIPKRPQPDGDNFHHECLQMLFAAEELSKKALQVAKGQEPYTELVVLQGKLLKEAQDVLERAKRERL